MAALLAVKKMSSGVLIGITLHFSTSLRGGACDASVDIGFEGISVYNGAAHLLILCAANANRLYDRTHAAALGPLRRLITCYNKNMAENLRSEVVALEPGSDFAEVLDNARLRRRSARGTEWNDTCKEPRRLQ